MNLKGFTMIEILLVVALIGVIGTLAIPSYRVMYERNELDTASNIYVQSLRRAQLLSQANMNQSKWGVHIEPGNITVFSGPSYSERNTDDDEMFDFSKSVEVEGIQEVTFDGIYGYPSAEGKTTLMSMDGASRVVTINKAGVPDF